MGSMHHYGMPSQSQLRLSRGVTPFRQRVSSGACCRKSRHHPRVSCKAGSQESEDSLNNLLQAIQGCERGVKNTQEQKSRILSAVDQLQALGKGQTTTGPEVDATWKLLWTTEKETLFILKNARLFNTEAGAVYQVIDTKKNFLQNVITFKNGASFVVDSSLENGGAKRLIFKFTAARLNLPSRSWKIPPFGKGWFDTVFLGDSIRVAKDIRGDTLIVAKEGEPRIFP